MPEQQDHAVSRPGAGDVTNGSVDYYPMEWEVVRREDGQPDPGGVRPDCGSNRHQQTDDAGGYEIVNE